MRRLFALSVCSAFAVGLVFLASSVAAPIKSGGVKIGAKGPSFKAITVEGKKLTSADIKGAKATVLCFTCNNCPVAVAYQDRFIEFVSKNKKRGVKFIAINVNKSETLEKMKQRADEKGYNFPYAYDETESSARAYGARVTPHLYVLDARGRVAYIGAFDDNMNTKKASKHYVQDAVDAVLDGKQPTVAETPAVGCGIKYR